MSKLKMTVATVAITVAASFSGNTASAQDVGGFFDKFVPRGKLIQKFRDEVNGGRPIITDPFSRDESPTPASAEEAAKRLAAQRPQYSDAKFGSAADASDGWQRSVES